MQWSWEYVPGEKDGWVKRASSKFAKWVSSDDDS